MRAYEIKELRQLKGENGHLKKLLAERNLKDEALKEIAARKW